MLLCWVHTYKYVLSSEFNISFFEARYTRFLPEDGGLQLLCGSMYSSKSGGSRRIDSKVAKVT